MRQRIGLGSGLLFSCSIGCGFVYSIDSRVELIGIEIDRGTSAGLPLNFSLLPALSLGPLFFLTGLFLLALGKSRA